MDLREFAKPAFGLAAGAVMSAAPSIYPELNNYVFWGGIIVMIISACLMIRPLKRKVSKMSKIVAVEVTGSVGRLRIEGNKAHGKDVTWLLNNGQIDDASVVNNESVDTSSKETSTSSTPATRRPALPGDPPLNETK